MLVDSKRVIVLSDNDGLARAIELNLRDYAPIDIVHLGWKSLARPISIVAGHCSLIIVATSAEGSEPVVALARASLLERIGRVPVLIISDRPFETDQVCQIAHLDFPFSITTLQDTVGRILYGAA